MPEKAIPLRTTKEEINVTNVVRRGIARQNAQTGKMGEGDTP
jgi:hypothetical protein